MDAKVYKNVIIGKNAEIGEYVIIGIPPKGKRDGELKTVIGDDAVIRSHTVIYAGNIIGNHFQTGHGAMIREENRIGNDVSIGTHSIVEHHVDMEDGVRVHSNAFVPEYSVLKEKCWIGPCVTITNAKFPLSRDSKKFLAGVYVDAHAKIGANSVLLPGVRIGRNALVGAGSVVTKDVGPDTVVVGNPASPMKKTDDLKHTDGKPAY